jgi:uncharacterized membrane protein HdeD (DUF308 family)
MSNVLTRNWGWVAARGVIAIIFGVLTLFYPQITLVTLVLWFGVFALADGISTVVAAIANRRGEPHWVAMLIGGVLSIAAGIITFVVPGITAITLLYLIALWAIIVGVTEIATAIKLRKVIEGEWMLVAAGLLTVALGVFLIARPGEGALAVVLWIGIYAIFSGVIRLALAFRLRSLGRSTNFGATPRPA